MTRIGRFRRDEAGATAIEYGLVAALLAVVVIASVVVLGDPVGALFANVAAEFNTVNEKL
nr:Flp family type IVb pilin [Devosia geojensis]